MSLSRRLPIVVFLACAAAGLFLAPLAPATTPAAPLPKAITCDQVVALGSTTPCDLVAAGDTARYRFSVPSADTVRFRAAVLDGFPSRTLTLSKSDGTEICTKSNFGQFECAVPSGGGYRLDVTVDAAVTVYTTVDTVLAATCGPSLDVSVGNPGSAVHIGEPGASWCAALDASAGEALEAVLDVDTDQSLTVSVYDDAGALLCVQTQVSAFARVGCLLSADAYRLFATPSDETAQDAMLIVTQISSPTGCVTRQPDPFGVAPTRHAALLPHQQTCYRFAGAAGHGVGAHLFAGSGPSGTLVWRLRTDAGATVCSGGPAGPDHRLTACTLPADGSYNLFVSMLARDTVRFALSLVDLSSDTGCVPVSSTAWNTDGDTGSLATRGEVDCATFTGTAGDRIRGSAFGSGATAAGLVTTADGGVVCEIVFRATCQLPATGTYRVALSTYVGTLAYRLWLIDMSSASGCRPTTTDAFGAAPARRARFGDNVAVCFSFVAPHRAAYYFRTAPAAQDLNAAAQIRSVDGNYVCTDPSCLPPEEGTYLYVLTRANFADDPADTGAAAAGLWRLDHPSNCTSLGTSFDSAAAAGVVVAPAKVDCHQFAGSAGDQVLVRTSPPFNSIMSQLFNRTGAAVCFAVSSTCTLTGAGPYRMLTYLGNLEGSTYRIRVASLTHPAGCTRLRATPFGSAPTRAFHIADPVDLLCYRISVPTAGQVGVRMVGVRSGAFHPSASVYGNGVSGSCAVSVEIGSCPVPESGDYLLVLSGNSSATGTMGWFDMSSSVGCTTGPSLAFGQPPTPSGIAGRGAVACMTLPLVGRDTARLAFGPSRSGMNLHAKLLERSGLPVCGLASGDRFPASCAVPRAEAGPERLIVYADEQSSVYSGTYRVHAWRLNSPTGCTDIGSLRAGFGPLVGRLSDKNAERCYLAQARLGTLAVTTSNDGVPDDVPLTQFVRNSGTVRCGIQGSGSCAVESGTYAVLVLRGSRPQDVDFAGHYRVAGSCTAGKCGP